MKKITLFFLVLLCFSSIAHANSKLYKNIANSVDSLLRDTVNEGEIEAQVSKARGRPEMACQLSPYREQDKGIAKCDITFNIKSTITGETQHCQQTCFLIHIYNLKTLEAISSVESLENNCIENLSSGCD